jgi:hypothetical protein
MRRVSFQKFARQAPIFILPSLLLLGAGCADSEIKTYKVAKEDNAPKLPAHFAGDGHDHSDGHNHTEGDGHDHGRSPGTVALPKLSWDTPKDWQALPADGMRKAIFRITGPEGKMAQVMVIPLPGVKDIELQSVNMWREELNLPALSQDEFAAQAQSVQVGDTKGELFEMANSEPRAGQSYKSRTLGAIAQRDNIMWFAKITGTEDLVAGQKEAFIGFLKSLKFAKPDIAEETAAVSTNTKELPANASAPKWNVPAHWQQKQAGPMVTAAYTVSGDEGQGEMSISKFPGDVGGMIANVNRWREQLGLEAMKASEVPQAVEMIEIDGKRNAYLVDLKGTNVRTGRPARMIAMGVPRAGETWFYKLLGDDPLVGKEKDTFLKFVVSAY